MQQTCEILPAISWSEFNTKQPVSSHRTSRPETRSYLPLAGASSTPSSPFHHTGLHVQKCRLHGTHVAVSGLPPPEDRCRQLCLTMRSTTELTEDLIPDIPPENCRTSAKREPQSTFIICKGCRQTTDYQKLSTVLVAPLSQSSERSGIAAHSSSQLPPSGIASVRR